MTARRPVIDLAAAIGGELSADHSRKDTAPGPSHPDAAERAATRLQKPARSRPRPKQEPEPGPEAETAPEVDAAALGRWRWQLGATARKAAAAQSRAQEAMQEWERLAADAAAAGVPARLVVAAAADADLPEPVRR